MWFAAAVVRQHPVRVTCGFCDSVSGWLKGGVRRVPDEITTEKKTWNVSLGNLTVTIAQLIFLAYTAGIVTERLEQVGNKLSQHLADYAAVNAGARISALEARLAVEEKERSEDTSQILQELQDIRSELKGR